METKRDISDLSSSAVPGTDMPGHVDVLLVGYGPVAACMAALLGKAGVSALVIDKADGILMMPRAIGMDHEGQRILQLVGVPEDAFAKKAIGTTKLESPRYGLFAQFYTKRVIYGFSQLVMFYQPDMERALRDQVERYRSVTTAQNTALIDLHDHGDHVAAIVETNDGQRNTITARYVVGADGASSTVRGLIGQDFKGRSYAEDWLIVDAKDAPNGQEHVTFHCNGTNPGPQLPAPGGRQRWEFMLPAGGDDCAVPTDELVDEMLQPFGGSAAMQVERKAIYRFHARSCAKYKVGRVFLAGDAAHITPPFIGQGLMSGLRDAVNLSWKLVAVIQGRAGAHILESYDVERRPHAKRMIQTARFMGALVMSRNPVKSLFVQGGLRLLRTIGPVRRWFDGAGMMPKMVMSQGTFIKKKSQTGLQTGTLFSQSLMRNQNGQMILSDELLNGQLTLVGFDTDPWANVPIALRARFEAAGGHGVMIISRGNQMPETIKAAEDMTGEFMTHTMPAAALAIVRPDGIILHEGLAKNASQLIAESLALLQGTQTPQHNLSSTIIERA